MKFILNFLILFIALTAFAGTELQDGGGGVFKQGRYMTYYTARIPIKPAPASTLQIPGMSYLLEKLSALTVLDEAKTQLLRATLPSGVREYHIVPAEALSPEVRKSIVAEYAKIFHCPESDVALFAVTDPLRNTTALFPEFFKLTETEQAAILFHESLWVSGKILTYQEVLDLEAAAQAYFETPQDEDAFYNFHYKISNLFTPYLNNLLLATLYFDRANPAAKLASTAQDGKILLQDLMGEKWLSCMLFSSDLCRTILVPELLLKSQGDPHSLFRRALLEFAMKPNSQINATRLNGYFDSSQTPENIKIMMDTGFYVDMSQMALSLANTPLRFPVLKGRQGPVVAYLELFY